MPRARTILRCLRCRHTFTQRPRTFCCACCVRLLRLPLTVLHRTHIFATVPRLPRCGCALLGAVRAGCPRGLLRLHAPCRIAAHVAVARLRLPLRVAGYRLITLPVTLFCLVACAAVTVAGACGFSVHVLPFTLFPVALRLLLRLLPFLFQLPLLADCGCRLPLPYLTVTTASCGFATIYGYGSRCYCRLDCPYGSLPLPVYTFAHAFVAFTCRTFCRTPRHTRTLRCTLLRAHILPCWILPYVILRLDLRLIAAVVVPRCRLILHTVWIALPQHVAALPFAFALCPFAAFYGWLVADYVTRLRFVPLRARTVACCRAPCGLVCGCRAAAFTFCPVAAHVARLPLPCRARARYVWLDGWLHGLALPFYLAVCCRLYTVAFTHAFALPLHTVRLRLPTPRVTRLPLPLVPVAARALPLPRTFGCGRGLRRARLRCLCNAFRFATLRCFTRLITALHARSGLRICAHGCLR